MEPLPERVRLLAQWAEANWPGGNPGRVKAEPIPADGSTRCFARLKADGLSLVGLYAPDNPAENRAWHYMAGHLVSRGLPVAVLKAAEPENGFFLMEDLRGASLQQMALQKKNDAAALRELYRPVLETLARLQRLATPKFDTSVCFDGKNLEPEFLLKREAGYFMAEFVSGACGMEGEGKDRGLWRDLAEICRLAGRAGPRGLVHRDFQSRNIIITANGPFMVDFQGARLGPSQYDLVSLLHDPYVDLPWAVREELARAYQDLREPLGGWDRARFEAGLAYVAASRIMQALGAYAFLTRKKGKPWFAAYVKPAVKSLKTLVADSSFLPFASYRRLVMSLPESFGPEAFAPKSE